MRRMMVFAKRMLGSLRGHKTQLSLAVRLAVAAVAAYAIARALHLMLPLWAVLTSLIVTQMSVGRSLKATRDYMLGTIGGAIYGGAIAVLIPHSGEGGLLALFSRAFYFHEGNSLVFHFVQVALVKLFAPRGVFALGVVLPGHVNVGEQIEIVRPCFDFVENIGGTGAEFYLAPHFDHI